MRAKSGSRMTSSGNHDGSKSFFETAGFETTVGAKTQSTRGEEVIVCDSLLQAHI
jgi:hypothetical protein